MKIIVSHDVDHLSVGEHLRDMIIPKFVARSAIELLHAKISVKEMIRRNLNLFSNKWNNIAELVNYNEQMGVMGTFFFGVNQGVGLNYTIDQATPWIRRVHESAMECGVHGINYQSIEGVKQEHDIFKQIIGSDDFGIRMHYLRNDPSTLELLSAAGYKYDTTIYGLEKHYKVNDMYEFPLHVMDGYEIEAGKKWQGRNLKESVASTISAIKNAQDKEIEYFCLLFHDRYFDDTFSTWKNWYMEVISYCKAQGFEFINYKQAIKELND